MLVHAFRRTSSALVSIRAELPSSENKRASDQSIKPAIPPGLMQRVIIAPDPNLSLWKPDQRYSALPIGDSHEAQTANAQSALERMRRYCSNRSTSKPQFQNNHSPSQTPPHSHEIRIFPFGENYSDPHQHIDPNFEDVVGHSQPNFINRLRERRELPNTQSLPSRHLPKPSVYSEAENVLDHLAHVLHASCALLSGSQIRIDAMHFSSAVSFGTTACRNYDSIHYNPGDHVLMFLAQISQASMIYRELFTLKGELPPADLEPSIAQLRVSSFLENARAPLLEKLAAVQRITLEAARIGHLSRGKPLTREGLRVIETILVANSLRALENDMVELCLPYASHPVCATFLRNRLSVFKGEVSISSQALPGHETDSKPNEAPPLGKIIHEIAAIHQSYSDVDSITIKNFSDIAQAIELRNLLRTHGLDELFIIANLDSTAGIDCFLMQAAVFRELHIGITIDSSRLQQESGTALAIIHSHRVAACARQHGVQVGQAVGASVRRGGYGFSNYLETQSFFRRCVSQDSDRTGIYRQTIPAAQADIELGNLHLAQQFLRKRQLFAPPNDVLTITDESHIDEAKEIFDAFIGAEQTARISEASTNFLAKLYQDYRVIATLRGLNSFKEAGIENDVSTTRLERSLAATPKFLHDGEAAQTDLTSEVLGLGCIAWARCLRLLSPEARVENIQRVREALRKGNPVVREIMLNLALQAAILYFSPHNQNRWQTAGFSKEVLEELHGSNESLQDYLKQTRYSLSNNGELQLCVMEYLGLDLHLPESERLNAIEKQVAIAHNAAINAIKAARHFEQTPLESLGKRQRLADICYDSLTKWAVNLGGFKS